MIVLYRADGAPNPAPAPHLDDLATDEGGSMSVSALLFYVYSAIALAGAAGLLAARKLAHGVMALFVTLLSMSALYLLLGSEFLAAMQLFVYGGAITVLMLFVLMLAKPSPESVGNPGAARRWVAAATTVVLFGVLITAIAMSRFTMRVPRPASTQALAETLFSRYVLPFRR